MDTRIERAGSSARWVAVGAGAFLLLHLVLRLTWQPLFAAAPWPGYEQVARTGGLAPFFTQSPRSLWLTLGVLFVLALTTMRARGVSRRRAALALWAGVMLAVVLVWVTTARLRRDANLWPIDLVFLAIVTAVPIAAGTLLDWRRATPDAGA